jgi:general stress protein YciG
MTEEKPRTKSTRGFASMSPERHREIAKKGGKAVPAEKRSYSQNHDLAAAAGRKGGQSVDPKKRTFSTDRALAASAGAKGGAVSPKRAALKEP